MDLRLKRLTDAVSEMVSQSLLWGMLLTHIDRRDYARGSRHGGSIPRG